MAERSDLDRDTEIATLRTELKTLRGLMTSLDAEIRRAQGGVDLTMRNQLRCRACHGRKIAHVPKVIDQADGGGHEMALRMTGFWGSTPVGKLETYVCMACGLVEWWVRDPSTLVPIKDELHILDGEAFGDGKAPYR